MYRIQRNVDRLVELMSSQLKSSCNALLAGIILLLISILPLVALILGARTINACPTEHRIPVWLVVVGVIGVVGCYLLIFLLLCQVGSCCRNDTRGDDDAPLIRCFSFLSCFLMLFYFAWMIVGAVWIFNAKANVQFDNPKAANYCDKSTFDYAFGLVITQICLAGLVEFVLLCCFIIVGWDRYSA